MNAIMDHPMHGLLELDEDFVVQAGEGTFDQAEIWKGDHWETVAASFYELERFCAMTPISEEEARRRTVGVQVHGRIPVGSGNG